MIPSKKHNLFSPSPKSDVLKVINLMLFRSNSSINILKISLTFINLSEGCSTDLCLANLFKNGNLFKHGNLFKNNHHMFCCCQKSGSLCQCSEDLTVRKFIKNPFERTIFLHWNLPVYWFPTPPLPIWSHLLYFDCYSKYLALECWQKPYETLKINISVYFCLLVHSTVWRKCNIFCNNFYVT